MSEYFVHPTALVESSTIGKGTKVWAFAHILNGAVIGENCNIGDHCFVESGVVVGDNVTIKNGNMLFEGVTIEDGVFIGPHVFFTNDRFPRSGRMAEAAVRYQTHDWLQPTLVKYGASIGAGSVIVCGNEIGEFAMVGASALVTKNVPAHALVVGAPARQIGWVCRCGQRLPLPVTTMEPMTIECSLCSTKYHLLEHSLKIIE